MNRSRTRNETKIDGEGWLQMPAIKPDVNLIEISHNKSSFASKNPKLSVLDRFQNTTVFGPIKRNGRSRREINPEALYFLGRASAIQKDTIIVTQIPKTIFEKVKEATVKFLKRVVGWVDVDVDYVPTSTSAGKSKIIFDPKYEYSNRKNEYSYHRLFRENKDMQSNLYSIYTAFKTEPYSFSLFDSDVIAPFVPDGFNEYNISGEFEQIVKDNLLAHIRSKLMMMKLEKSMTSKTVSPARRAHKI